MLFAITGVDAFDSISGQASYISRCSPVIDQAD
jgi:hypothetical protein